MDLNYIVVNASEYHGDFSTVPHDTLKEAAWGIIAVYPNASRILRENLRNPSSEFSPDDLVSFYYAEARQEDIHNGIILLPLVQSFSQQWEANFRNSWWNIVNSTLTTLETRDRVYQTKPSILTNSVHISLKNLRSVFGTVYTAILLTGLIFPDYCFVFPNPIFRIDAHDFYGKSQNGSVHDLPAICKLCFDAASFLGLFVSVSCLSARLYAKVW